MEQTQNQTVKERLKSFIDYKKISVRAFEAACGLSYGFVGNMRNSMQPDKLMKIVHCFPELNPGWIMTGDGDMLRPNYTQKVYGGEKITQTGDINDGISSVLIQAMSEISEMRKLLSSALEANQRTNDRLLSLLEKCHGDSE